MVAKKPMKGKKTNLQVTGTLNPKPEMVKDELFGSEEFFDPKDFLQVKYEMLRRVDRDGWTVTKATNSYGLSRPSFYETKRAFEDSGLAGLIPKIRGPKSPHKLTDDILEFAAKTREKTNDPAEIAVAIKTHFGVEVHPRSISRALKKRIKKKGVAQ